VRKRASRLLRGAGYLLRRDAQGRGLHPPADLPYDTCTKLARQALRTQDPAGGGRPLKDRVIHFFGQHEVPLSRILIDRGTEYYSALERREHELDLALENIDYARTKVKSPESNGSVERFHKTVVKHRGVVGGPR